MLESDLRNMALQKLSIELENMEMDLRLCEESLNRSLTSASPEVTSEDIERIQKMDLIIQKLSSLASFSKNVSQDCSDSYKYNDIVKALTLEELRDRFSEETLPKEPLGCKNENTIEMF